MNDVKSRMIEELANTVRELEEANNILKMEKERLWDEVTALQSENEKLQAKYARLKALVNGEYEDQEGEQ